MRDETSRSKAPNPFMDTTINYQTQVEAKLTMRHDRELVKEEENFLTQTLLDMDPEAKA